MLQCNACDFLSVSPSGQYSASVAEELPAGQSIATVSASDGDRPSTPNSDIEYSIANVFATSGSVDPVNFSLSCILCIFICASIHTYRR